MPIYEYECPSCHTVKEYWRSIYETDDVECPTCSVHMHKLISQSSFQLKGGGWYADGYCKRSKGNKTGPEKGVAPSCKKADSKSSAACQGCH